jgi:PhnB protein
VSIYLNYAGETEAAFEFYRSVFGGELSPIMRMGDVPAGPPLTEAERNYVMHVELEILGGTVLMGTDAIESMGQKLVTGTNFSINLEPDTLAEGQRLFDGLSAGGSQITPLQEMFWGAHWAAFVDRFGMRWMINVPAAAPAPTA